MKRITKHGPQLTAAQALDFILYTLDTWRRAEDKKIDFQKPEVDHIALGKALAYDAAFEFILTLRAEKFADDQTEDPIKRVENSKSYGL